MSEDFAKEILACIAEQEKQITQQEQVLAELTNTMNEILIKYSNEILQPEAE